MTSLTVVALLVAPALAWASPGVGAPSATALERGLVGWEGWIGTFVHRTHSSPASTVVLPTLDGVNDVAFAESGLSLGTPWSVLIAGVRESTNSSVVYLELPRGTFVYQVEPVAGYEPSPSAGGVTVGSSGAIVDVSFAPFEYPVLFTALGLPATVPWSVTIGGMTYDSGPHRAIEMQLPNGTYSYDVKEASFAYSANGYATELVVAGEPVWRTATFSPRLGELAGSVLPARATVLLNGTPIVTTNGTFSVAVLPGTYLLTATFPGFLNLTQTVVVSAGNSTLARPFDLAPLGGPRTSPHAPASAGMLELGGPTLLAGGALALAAVLAAWRSRYRRRSEAVFLPPPTE